MAFVDPGDAAALEAGLGRGPKLVLVETPGNPLMRVRDIQAIADKAHAAGVWVIVDNTFLSPALQRPIAHGADFVVHSTTKHIKSHSDAIGGAVVATATADVEERSAWATIAATAGAPFDVCLTLRGLHTLFPRVERQQANAMAVAILVAGHPRVSAVHYPGHALATQPQGFSAMLSFELRGGTEAVRRLGEAVEVFTLAESRRGIESLVAHPATMTRAGMGPEARRAAGISDSLLRPSAGLEPETDLVADLSPALVATEGVAQQIDARPCPRQRGRITGRSSSCARTRGDATPVIPGTRTRCGANATDRRCSIIRLGATLRHRRSLSSLMPGIAALRMRAPRPGLHE